MKSEIFVVAFKNAEGVKYAGLDSRDSLIKNENPSSFKHYFTHEQATALVKALRAKGLDEGVEVRAKSLMQSVRDYSYQVLLKSKEAETTDEETMAKVVARYKPAKTETKKKEEAPVEEPETDEPAETVETEAEVSE